MKKRRMKLEIGKIQENQASAFQETALPTMKISTIPTM